MYCVPYKIKKTNTDHQNIISVMKIVLTKTKI